MYVPNNLNLRLSIVVLLLSIVSTVYARDVEKAPICIDIESNTPFSKNSSFSPELVILLTSYSNLSADVIWDQSTIETSYDGGKSWKSLLFSKDNAGFGIKCKDDWIGEMSYLKFTLPYETFIENKEELSRHPLVQSVEGNEIILKLEIPGLSIVIDNNLNTNLKSNSIAAFVILLLIFFGKLKKTLFATTKENFESVKTLIAKGELKLAIEAYLTEVKEKEIPHESQVLLLSARLNSLQKNKGLINDECFQVNLNKITESFLYLINE